MFHRLHPLKNRRAARNWALAVCLAGIALHGFTLQDGHNWGGDFSQYILHAKNLVEGESYGAGIFPRDDGRMYPPGLPLLLTPVVAAVGADLYWMKWIAVTFMAVILWIVQRDSGATPLSFLVFALLFLSNAWIFQFKQNILSDLPFTAFTTYAILLWHRSREGSPSGLAAALLVSCLALLTRSAGLAVFATLIAASLVSKKWGRLACVVAAGIAMIRFQVSLGASSGGYANELPGLSYDEIKYWTALFGGNVIYYIERLGALLLPLNGPAALIMGLASLAAIFRWALLKNRTALIFTLVYMLIICLWPARQNSRLMLPLLPWVLIALSHQMTQSTAQGKSFLKPVALLVGCLMLVLNVVGVRTRWDVSFDQIQTPVARDMARWVSIHCRDSEYAFQKPRTLALLTGKRGFVLNAQLDPEAFADRLVSNGIKHAITWRDHKAAVMLDDLGSAKLVWKNREFAIFEIDR